MSLASNQVDSERNESISAADRLTRLKFLNFSARDEMLLKGLKPVIEANVGDIVTVFYEHLQSFPETAQLLQDRSTITRLKKLQREYLLRAVDGDYGEAYFAQRQRIGRTHERVGLPPHWYLLSYVILLRTLVPLIRKHFGSDPDRADESVQALEKLFVLDASLGMDAYMASDRYRHFKRLESIVNDSADAIFMVDTSMRFRTWNNAAEEIFGWRADEIIGRPLSVIVPEDVQRSGELERIQQDALINGHVHLESVRVAKDGRRLPVELTVSWLYDGQGNPIGSSSILRDITAHKRLQEAHLRAERLSLIGTMAAKLAHEIRNPLSSIGLNLDLLKDELTGLEQTARSIEDIVGKETTNSLKRALAEAQDLTLSIGSEVRRIRNVTEDYLKFARLPKIRMERLSLNRLLQRHLDFLNPAFVSNNVELETVFDETLPDISADEEQLWQAVLNLVRNSLEAMPDGGRLRIKTERIADTARLIISDTGCGMSPETRAKLFMPFFSTKHSGTGLGMALTLQIVTEHGGTIKCDSAQGKGTTITITLPMFATLPFENSPNV